MQSSKVSWLKLKKSPSWKKSTAKRPSWWLSRLASLSLWPTASGTVKKTPWHASLVRAPTA